MSSSNKRAAPQVVIAAVGFPFSKRTRPREGPQKPKKEQSQKHLLDFHDTYKEIKKFGAKGFEKKQKRRHEDELYEVLTGRKRKHHQVPLPILRGVKKKAAEREARQSREEKDAGIVTHRSSEKKKRQRYGNSSDIKSQLYGPAPSIGFMSKGVLQLKRKPK